MVALSRQAARTERRPPGDPHGKQRMFDVQQSHQPDAAGAERHARRELATPRHPARQDQIDHVDAGNAGRRYLAPPASGAPPNARCHRP